MICENCKKEFKIKGNKRFCSRKCYNEFHKIERYKEYLKDNSIAHGQQNMQNFKRFFLEEQEHRCAICNNFDTWNGKQLIFILDHIDGDADNNNRTNLRLICPNCDSQLATFKSKNKISARRKYRK